jgi:hypothetical protein
VLRRVHFVPLDFVAGAPFFAAPDVPFGDLRLVRRDGECRNPNLPGQAWAGRGVAQLARAPVSKTGGWGFETLHPCQDLQTSALPGRDGMPAAAERCHDKTSVQLFGVQ